MSADLKWASEERKLGSVFDDLNEQRHKSAQATLDRHLKKSPNSQPALALSMALALQTSAGEDTILSFWDRCRKTGELSSRSSYVVLYALRGAGRHDLCMEVYKALWEARPAQLELGEEVFWCAAACENIDLMISTSRTLYNKSKDPKWARLAAWSNYELLHLPENLYKPEDDPLIVNGQKTCSLLLTMANRQEPLHDDTSIQLVYLNFWNLITIGEKAAALKLAQDSCRQGDLLTLYHRLDFVSKTIDGMEDGENRRAALTVEFEWICEHLVQNSEHLNYIYCQHLNWVVTRSPSLGYARKARQLFTILHSGRTRKSEIGYILAILDMDVDLVEEERLGREQWRHALRVYWETSGGRMSSVNELRRIVGGHEWKLAMVDEVLGHYEYDIKTITTALEYYKTLTVSKLGLLRHRRDWVPEAEIVQKTWDLYLLPTKKSLQDLPKQDPTDVYVGDEAGFSVVHMLVLQWLSKPSDEKPLLTALACALSIYERSQPSGPAKFLLVRLARFIGAGGLLPSKWLDASGPAEVQLDTLLHTAVERASGEVYAKTVSPNWSSAVERAEKMYKRALADIPEQIKAAYQNEAYTSIPGMHKTKEKLTSTLAGGMVRVERARLTLLSGALPSPERLRYIETAVGLAATGSMPDYRDWELMPGFGPEEYPTLPLLRHVTALANDIKMGWVHAWGSVVLAVARYLSGQPATKPEIAEENYDVTKEERVLLSGLSTILGRIEQTSTVLTKAELKALADAPPEESLSGLFNGLLPEESEGARWNKMYPFHLIVEASKLLDRIHKRVQADAQPTGTGKQKKKADPRIVALENQLSELKTEVAGLASKAVERVDKLAKEDEAISAQDIASIIQDLELKHAEAVVEHRKIALDNLRKVLQA